MRKLLIPLVSSLLLLTSCTEETKYGKPLVKPENILKNFMNYLKYNERFVKFSEEFTALDATQKPISKESFFTQLNSGDYLPLRLQSTDSSNYYQLYKLPTGVDQSIASTIRRYAEIDYAFYKMEGRSIPKFNFTDLNGDSLTSINTKNKLLVLKCWFINCVPCVKEMPALNELVAQYKNRSDILFVSLALDKADKLKDFMRRTKFAYTVVPDQNDYIMNKLGITAFPTHLIISKEGKIAKVVNNHKELETALETFANP